MVNENAIQKQMEKQTLLQRKSEIETDNLSNLKFHALSPSYRRGDM